MYGIVSVLGSILRQIYLPNPFLNLFTSQGIADLFNLIVGGSIISFLAYVITGSVYERGSAPAIGSFIYTFNYALITFSFYGVTILIKNIIFAVVVYLILYIIIYTLLFNLKNKTIKF